MGILDTCIVMVETKAKDVGRYDIVLSSYYHIKSIFDQNTNIVLKLAGGFHF